MSELCAVLVHLDMVGQKVDFDRIREIKSEVLKELREMKDIRDVRAAHEAKHFI